MSFQPEFSSETSDGHKQIIVSGVYGGARPFGLEAILYSEKQDVEKVIRTQPPIPQKQ